MRGVRANLTGRRFERLCVVSRADDSRDGRTRWTCRCDCGAALTTLAASLLGGATRSCGCLHRELAARNKTTHGRWNTATYRAWADMITRCMNRKRPNFDRYGGRGITVCNRWLNFNAFRADMGDRPRGLTLDRINNDGNYEPGNCR